MNAASGPEASSITIIAATIAAIITRISSAMPTAVITLSSENTTSSTMISMTVPAKLAAARPVGSSSSTPSTRRWISRVPLNNRKAATGDQDQIAP